MMTWPRVQNALTRAALLDVHRCDRRGRLAMPKLTFLIRSDGMTVCIMPPDVNMVGRKNVSAMMFLVR